MYPEVTGWGPDTTLERTRNLISMVLELTETLKWELQRTQNSKIRPRADKNFEKWGIKSVGAPTPSNRGAPSPPPPPGYQCVSKYKVLANIF